jgi:hypothetical protein
MEALLQKPKSRRSKARAEASHERPERSAQTGGRAEVRDDDDGDDRSKGEAPKVIAKRQHLRREVSNILAIDAEATPHSSANADGNAHHQAAQNVEHRSVATAGGHSVEELKTGEDQQDKPEATDQAREMADQGLSQNNANTAEIFETFRRDQEEAFTDALGSTLFYPSTSAIADAPPNHS